MCPICRRYSNEHHPSCPYADDPVPVKIGKCEICDEDVTTGEEIVRDGDCIYHFDCLSGLSTHVMLEVLGYNISIAECE